MSRDVVVVTGAAGGIGAETCRALRAAGLEPFVADLDGVAATALAEELGCGWFALDVTSTQSWMEMRQELEVRDLGATSLVLNAGLAGGGQLDTFDTDRYHAMFAVNVDGVIHGLTAFIHDLVELPASSVVVTASLAGLVGTPFDPVYAMTKHALIGLVRSAAPTFAGRGVRVQAVCPGIVDTSLLGEAKAELDTADYPLLTSGEVADVIVQCVRGLRTDTVVVVQVGREPTAYRFAGIPGPGVASPPLPEHLPIGRVRAPAQAD